MLCLIRWGRCSTRLLSWEGGGVLEVFDVLNDERIADVVSNTKSRLIYAAPGVSIAVAKAIIGVHEKLRKENIEVIIDESPKVCRFGYGEIEAVEALVKSDISVRKCHGIRIGIVLVDDRAWAFSPTPLLLENYASNCVGAPNALKISEDQIISIVAALSSRMAVKECFDSLLTKGKAPLKEIPAPDIDYSELKPEELSATQEELKRIPPERFDLARQVRVYKSYVQFVELKLKGADIQRRTIQIPVELLNVTGNEQVQARLRSNYRMISGEGSLSSQEITDRVNKLRKRYCHSLGERYGTVILRSIKEEFVKEVESIRTSLDLFKQEVKSKIQNEIERCKNDLITLFLPGIQQSPPEELRVNVIGGQPTVKEIEMYISYKLDECMPDPNVLYKDMQLTCNFKDVTYETLNEAEFVQCLRRAYPLISWNELPYEENIAAMGHQST